MLFLGSGNALMHSAKTEGYYLNGDARRGHHRHRRRHGIVVTRLAMVYTIINVDIKKFITDHIWFGWYYWNPPQSEKGFWERIPIDDLLGQKRKWKQRVDWDKVFKGE